MILTAAISSTAGRHFAHKWHVLDAGFAKFIEAVHAQVARYAADATVYQWAHQSPFSRASKTVIRCALEIMGSGRPWIAEALLCDCVFRLARAPLSAQLLQQLPGPPAQQADHDLAIRERGVVIGNLAQPRCLGLGGDRPGRHAQRMGCIHDEAGPERAGWPSHAGQSPTLPQRSNPAGRQGRPGSQGRHPAKAGPPASFALATGNPRCEQGAFRGRNKGFTDPPHAGGSSPQQSEHT